MGYATECDGIASLHRLLLSGMCGVLAPNNHLQQLNPHLNFDNKAALLTVTRQLSVDSCLFLGFFGTEGGSSCLMSLLMSGTTGDSYGQ